ncbi:MAG: DUF1653 domain-containing protein [Nanoarchaeota archaeon]|nr:DUF1653 domain-containing protein [Nanoarchaeota archaeon]
MIRKGKYRHFKGGVYEVLDTAVHTETGETLVIYQSLENNKVWARPLKNFLEEINKKDYQGPRFTFIDN